MWILISVPLVTWDNGYVFLRPHSMPGGSVHRPVWVPYALYGTVDYMYGWPAYDRNDGFPNAQAVLNVVESALLLWYLWIVYKYGSPSDGQGRGAPKPEKLGWLGKGRVVRGRMAGVAPLVGHASAVMTFSKTALYCKCRCFDLMFGRLLGRMWLSLVWLCPAQVEEGKARRPRSSEPVEHLCL